MLTVHKDSMVAVSKLFYFHAPDNPHGALTPLLIFIEHLSSPPELVHNFMLTFSEVYEPHAHGIYPTCAYVVPMQSPRLSPIDQQIAELSAQQEARRAAQREDARNDAMQLAYLQSLRRHGSQ